MFDHGFTLNSSLNMTPQIISESATSYSNSELMYPGSASLERAWIESRQQ
jgi:hypothetical protein